MNGINKCFACDRPLGKTPRLVGTRDGQIVFIGSDCYKLAEAGGNDGWQPPKGGPRLWTMPKLPKEGGL